MSTISRIETFMVPPRRLTVRTASRRPADLLVGRDAARIGDHWQVTTTGSEW